ncbi:hypothetical protein HPP92_023745 [Vanilla planifolia]|uniref:PHD-type domain-containing protein n=1 Tax=Vanilla planifolia TaxID=51239 RepID=A0A835UER6_VANPL|nr:hypothetical protein HPP92_023745 [Vanilla planifolia]
MAAGSRRRTNTRETNLGEVKLLEGEEVEVLYFEDGLMGSWHIGVIIGCGKLSRTVELADLLSEDNCSKLVDSIPVSAAIEGLNTFTSKFHRNRIRPLPPKYKIKVNEIRYGLCVDAFVDDAWWEGVVFDHEEGSLQRLIFFPDQGDQQVVSLEKLRITQEWNEASGVWKIRGEWQLLEVLASFEQKGELPVSVREIWYDLRSTQAFSRKIRFWGSGSISVWRKYVTELIQELLCVINGLPVDASVPHYDELENSGDFDTTDCPMESFPGSDGNVSHEDIGNNYGFDVKATKVPLLLEHDVYSSYHTPASAKLVNCSYMNKTSQLLPSRDMVCRECALILSSGNETNKVRELTPHAKPWNCDLKLYDLANGRLCDSHAKEQDCFQEFKHRNCVNPVNPCNYLIGNNEGPESYHSTYGTANLQASGTWQLMDLEAQNCAEAISLYLDRSANADFQLEPLKAHKKKFKSVKACAAMLKNQLLQNRKQKWDHIKSADGSHFGSICYELLCSSPPSGLPRGNALNVLLPLKEKHHLEDSSHVPVGNTNTGHIFQGECRLLCDMTQSNYMPNCGIMKDESRRFPIDDRHNNFASFSSERGGLISEFSKNDFCVHDDIEAGHFPGSIIQYIDYIDSIRGISTKKHSGTKANLVRLNAKKHLLFLGWKVLRSKCELSYVSASGKRFRSLYSACKASLEEENNEPGTSGTPLNGKSKRRSDFLYREMIPENVKKKILRRLHHHMTAMTDEDFKNALKLLENDVKTVIGKSSKYAESMACYFSKIFSREWRASGKRTKASSNKYQCLDHRSLKKLANCTSDCEHTEKGKTLPNRMRHRFLSCSHRIRRSGKRSRMDNLLSPSQHVSRTILSLLIENDVVLPRQKVMYIHKRDKQIMMEGRITREGIKCDCCSKVYTLSNFEVHAGSTLCHPATNIYLKDGRSLLQCQMQMLSSKVPKGFPHSRQKNDCSTYESDGICSVCHDGGSLILCDHCPSSFHLDCVGLLDVPQEKWFCPSCQCHVCGQSEFNPDTEQFTEKTILYCDQCEHEYHVGCIREKGWGSLHSRPSGNWFCSRSCSKIFLYLRRLVGVAKPTNVEGLSCTILRFGRDFIAGSDHFDPEVMVEHHSKLCVALKVLHECFVTIIEPPNAN